jgi:hypothetical protein
MAVDAYEYLRYIGRYVPTLRCTYSTLGMGSAYVPRYHPPPPKRPPSPSIPSTFFRKSSPDIPPVLSVIGWYGEPSYALIADLVLRIPLAVVCEIAVLSFA